jgi:hypothetical protein
LKGVLYLFEECRNVIFNLPKVAAGPVKLDRILQVSALKQKFTVNDGATMPQPAVEDAEHPPEQV